MDSIGIDNDGLQGLPTLVNVRSIKSIPQARGTGCNVRTTQNKHVNFFSCVGLNKVAVPKRSKVSMDSKITFAI